jgi:hypothetical protein
MDIEVAQQPFDLQMELCDLQLEPFLFSQSKKLISGRFLKNAISSEVTQASEFLP